MKKSSKWNIQTLKDWWWVVGIVVGGIVIWGNLPMRMAKAEQQIDDLKGWAKEIQGYTRANQQLQQQQAPNQAAPAVREWRDPDTDVWWCCPERSGCEHDADWYQCE